MAPEQVPVCNAGGATCGQAEACVEMGEWGSMPGSASGEARECLVR